MSVYSFFKLYDSWKVVLAIPVGSQMKEMNEKGRFQRKFIMYSRLHAFLDHRTEQKKKIIAMKKQNHLL
ncbi:unnamed protein product [Caretta caretta]